MKISFQSWLGEGKIILIVISHFIHFHAVYTLYLEIFLAYSIIYILFFVVNVLKLLGRAQILFQYILLEMKETTFKKKNIVFQL